MVSNRIAEQTSELDKDGIVGLWEHREDRWINKSIIILKEQNKLDLHVKFNSNVFIHGLRLKKFYVTRFPIMESVGPK